MRLRDAAACAAMGLFCLSATAPAMAQQSTDDLQFQLNNATTESGACQLTFVIKNNTGVTIQESWYNVAFADTDGKVNTVTLKFQPLPTGKPRVQQFALTGQPCETLAGLFINSVTKCTGTDGSDLTVCDDKYSESSRIGIQFPWQP